MLLPLEIQIVLPAVIAEAFAEAGIGKRVEGEYAANKLPGGAAHVDKAVSLS